jgi:hypothetical protein
VATAAVNAAVSMKTLEAPTVQKSYIALNRNSTTSVDNEGLPLVYDKDLIEAYWSKERGALNQRWVSDPRPRFAVHQSRRVHTHTHTHICARILTRTGCLHHHALLSPSPPSHLTLYNNRELLSARPCHFLPS